MKHSIRFPPSASSFIVLTGIYALQLGLLVLRKQIGHQQVAQLDGRLVQVEAHALGA